MKFKVEFIIDEQESGVSSEYIKDELYEELGFIFDVRSLTVTQIKEKEEKKNEV